MLNKPAGVVSSMRDEQGRPDLSRVHRRAIRSACSTSGRLDAETSGLLILTNDGELAHVLAHPSFGVTKTYIAQVRGRRLRRRPSARLDAGRRARGRPDRGRQGAAARAERVAASDEPRRADPALRAQPHRAADAGRGRPSGDRARPPAVRAAAPRHPRRWASARSNARPSSGCDTRAGPRDGSPGAQPRRGRR